MRLDPITRPQKSPAFQAHPVSGAGKHQVTRPQADACIQIIEQLIQGKNHLPGIVLLAQFIVNAQAHI
ncbi:hypothetical protein D3C86_2144690 [compost metagenome]